MTGNKPVKKYRYGAIQIDVWENEVKTAKGTAKFSSVSYQRNYKDKDNKWASTTSLRMNDIPKLIYGMQQAYIDMVNNSPEDEN